MTIDLNHIPESMNETFVLMELFPEILRPLVPPFFDRLVRKERDATCDRCAMNREDGMANREGKMLHLGQHLKCCTYFPRIPNFILGDLLADASAELQPGRDIIRRIILDRSCVTPVGCHPSARYDFMYTHLEDDCFGRLEEITCPFLGAGESGCLIWPFRDRVCRTYFCLFEAGIDGRNFWSALRDYLGHLERMVALYALKEIGFPYWRAWKEETVPSKLSLEDARGKTSPGRHAEIWGEWSGREEELYLACRHVAAHVSPSQLPTILGLTGEVFLARLGERLQAVDHPSIPRFLRFGSGIRIDTDGQGRILLKSDLGMYRVSPELYRAIRSFDGCRDVDRTLADIRADESLGISPGLLLGLYRHRILE